MDMKIIILIILAAIIAAFFLIRNFVESKTDDVEKEINRVMRKNRKPSEKTYDSIEDFGRGEKPSGRASDGYPRKAPDKSFDSEVIVSKLKKIYARIKQLSENEKKLAVSLIAMALVAIIGCVSIIPALDYYPEDEDYLYGGLVMPDSYELTDYNVIDDSTIIDKNGVRVWIEGFYEDTFSDDDPGEPIIHFVVSNDTENDVSVSFDIVGVNGCCVEACQQTVETSVNFEESADVLSYVFTGADLTVKKFVLSHLTVVDETTDEYIYGETEEEYNNVFSFDTDSDEDIYTDPWDTEPIYDENSVRIYKSGTMLCVENNSEHNFGVTARALPQDEKTENVICEDVLLPYGYSMNISLSRDYDVSDIDKSGISFSFDFECTDTEGSDFKTGIIK